MFRKLIVSVVAQALVATDLFATGASDGAGDDVKQISWQVWVTPNLALEHYRGVADDFEASRGDVKVDSVEANAAVTSSGDDFFKTRLAAGDVPDLVGNLGSIPEYADAGLLWPIPTDDPDLSRILALDSTAYKGVNYSFPGTVQIQGVMFYNKTQWAQAGLSEADIPTTWAATEQICATLQAAGLTPMITGGEWVTGYALSILQAAPVFAENPNWYADRWAGEVGFTDDEWVEATAFFKRLVDNGYFNKGASVLATPIWSSSSWPAMPPSTRWAPGSPRPKPPPIKTSRLAYFWRPTRTAKRTCCGAWRTAPGRSTRSPSTRKSPANWPSSIASTRSGALSRSRRMRCSRT